MWTSIAKLWRETSCVSDLVTILPIRAIAQKWTAWSTRRSTSSPIFSWCWSLASISYLLSTIEKWSIGFVCTSSETRATFIFDHNPPLPRLESIPRLYSIPCRLLRKCESSRLRHWAGVMPLITTSRTLGERRNCRHLAIIWVSLTAIADCRQRCPTVIQTFQHRRQHWLAVRFWQRTVHRRVVFTQTTHLNRRECCTLFLQKCDIIFLKGNEPVVYFINQSIFLHLACIIYIWSSTDF